MNAVEQTVKYIEAGLQSLNMQSSVEVEEDSSTEFWIKLPELGVAVFVDCGDPDGPSEFGENVFWQVFTVTQLPATMHEPEDEDYIHRRSCQNVADAVAEVFALVTRDHILNMIEFIGLAEEQDEFVRATDGYREHPPREMTYSEECAAVADVLLRDPDFDSDFDEFQEFVRGNRKTWGD